MYVLGKTGLYWTYSPEATLCKDRLGLHTSPPISFNGEASDPDPVREREYKKAKGG